MQLISMCLSYTTRESRISKGAWCPNALSLRQGCQRRCITKWHMLKGTMTCSRLMVCEEATPDRYRQRNHEVRRSGSAPCTTRSSNVVHDEATYPGYTRLRTPILGHKAISLRCIRGGLNLCGISLVGGRVSTVLCLSCLRLAAP
jgi:hypothetical protein